MTDSICFSLIATPLKANGYYVQLERGSGFALLRLIHEDKQAESVYGISPGEEKQVLARVIREHGRPEQQDDLLSQISRWP